MLTHRMLLDTASLSHKYKVDAPRAIRGWRAGKSDSEIAAEMGSSVKRIRLMREEIKAAHIEVRRLTRHLEASLLALKNQ